MTKTFRSTKRPLSYEFGNGLDFIEARSETDLSAPEENDQQEEPQIEIQEPESDEAKKSDSSDTADTSGFLGVPGNTRSKRSARSKDFVADGNLFER